MGKKSRKKERKKVGVRGVWVGVGGGFTRWGPESNCVQSPLQHGRHNEEDGAHAEHGRDGKRAHLLAESNPWKLDDEKMIKRNTERERWK